MRCDADEMVGRCLIVDDNDGFLAVAQANLEHKGLAVALIPTDDHRGVEPITRHEIRRLLASAGS